MSSINPRNCPFCSAPDRLKWYPSGFTPVGFNPILEKAILPNEEKIYKAAKELLDY